MKKTMIAALLAMGVSGCSSLYGTPQSAPVADPGATAFYSGYQALQADDYVTAEQAMAAALRANPNDPYANLGMGYVMHNTNRAAQAAPFYNNAVTYGEETYPERFYDYSGPQDYTVTEDWSVADYARRNLSAL